MIRTYRKTDLEEMVRIWYDASVIAHPFVPASFWASHKSAMKEKYLPLAENYVFEQEGKVAGFISLVGERVCALFISPDAQGKGMGKALLEHAKALKGRLSLKVYRDNKKAILFYEKSGLKAAGEEVDEHTGCLQILMGWEISNLRLQDFDA
ncbi:MULTISPECIES: N-acetyltransferase [unclassified Methanosarcina]|uniref:N-acetyltransferase n=1 Tax=unclassified Methanosarcina TaxID=2644672 RepID=UPI000615CDAB|nr:MULTISPECIES: N-acetyltransferase [unclassified Methanosarcina]AKB19589.1 Acetyltransferase [Methanosarcina sp. WWM596]AKB22625.1 Acetyltransferase [Methanosarcina sp. WH1]